MLFAAKCRGLTAAEKMQRGAGVIELPTAKDLGFIWDRELVIAPGGGGTNRLEEVIVLLMNTKNSATSHVNGTSNCCFKFGAIGIRTVWAATIAALENSRSDEVETSIRAWQQELAWREFYQHA